MNNTSFRDLRHIDKTFYLGADERFYEPNYAHYKPKDELSSIVASLIAARGLPWRLYRSDVWTHVFPSGPVRALPKQGWKIHVSATNVNCGEILETVASIALDRGIQFKFANDIETLRLMTSKRWPRGGSGKFITIYPRSNEEFGTFIEFAYQNLQSYAGSYILSDRRYKDSRCLYYRYGGMQPTTRTDYTGRKLEILTSPDGEEVVDQRSPYYELPHWISDIFPEESGSQNDELTLNEGRFVVKSALAFSNTGGVYLAHDSGAGRDVVIKEARPFVELGLGGRDATSRLAQEEKVLRILDGTGISPRVYATFWDWENFYLVEEYLEATDLRQVMMENTPLLSIYPTKAKSAEFYEKYKAIFIGVLGAVDRIHAANVVIGDLSPTNIMVEQTTMTVRIIDLEGAFQPGVDTVEDLHTPGFRAEAKGRKRESNYRDDVYAIGAIMMYSMFPIAAMAYIRSDLFSKVLPALVQDMGWSNTPVQNVIQQLVNNSISCREAIEQLQGEASITQPLAEPPSADPALPLADLCGELARFITSNYRLAEPYALFPIDPYGLRSNPAGFGFGATGIIYSLRKCGFEVPPEAMRRYRDEVEKSAELPPGFLVGSAGMAWALIADGEVDAGERLMQQANSSPLARAHHSLYYGMAGIGMANLAAFLRTGKRNYLDIARALAETLAATAVESDRGLYWQDEGRIHIGFGYGQSGVALFLLRLSQVLGEPEWRDMGQRALEYDLSFGVESAPGVVSFGDEPGNIQTLEQYIEQGSGGIAKVAIRYGLWDRVGGLLADVYRKYSVLPGLIYGLTGFLDVLTDAHIYSGDTKYLDMAERPLRGLRDLYLFDAGEGYAAPGENLFRISCDYASGLAGVMLTLHRRENLLPDEFCLDVLDKRPVVSV